MRNGTVPRPVYAGANNNCCYPLSFAHFRGQFCTALCGCLRRAIVAWLIRTIALVINIPVVRENPPSDRFRIDAAASVSQETFSGARVPSLLSVGYVCDPAPSVTSSRNIVAACCEHERIALTKCVSRAEQYWNVETAWARSDYVHSNQWESTQLFVLTVHRMIRLHLPRFGPNTDTWYLNQHRQPARRKFPISTGLSLFVWNGAISFCARYVLHVFMLLNQRRSN